jgi:hypothetical protein
LALIVVSGTEGASPCAVNALKPTPGLVKAREKLSAGK